MAVLLGVVTAFEVGGRIGYTLGSNTSSSWEAVSQGIDSYRVLIRLPDDAPEEVRKDLERDIDYALINYLFLVDREPHRFDLFPLPLDPCQKMPELAAHRATNPSLLKDPDQLDLIEQAIRRLSTAEYSVERTSHKCGRPSAA